MIRASIADFVRRGDAEVSLENIAASISVDRQEIEALMKTEEPLRNFLGLTILQAIQLQELFLPIGVDFFSTELMSKARELESRAGEMRLALDSRKKK